MIPKLIVVLFTGCLLGFTSTAQTTTATLYEFEYHFAGENKVYKAFLSRNKNATGFIRLAFNNNQNLPVVVEMQLYQHYDDDNFYGAPDSSAICFEGTEPKVIKGNLDITLDKMIFRFKKNPATGIYDPIEVMKRDDATFQKILVETSSSKLLQAQDLTSAFLQKYYRPDENLFINAAQTGTSPLAKSAHLYLVSVANTKAMNIAGSCRTDRTTMLTIFEAVAKKLHIPFIPIDIYDDNFNADTVNNALAGLKPTSDDIVVFHYSGHGFVDRDPKIKFPRMDLRSSEFDDLDPKQEIQMEKVFQLIVGKGARLNLILSDCCNSTPGAKIPVARNPPSTRSSPIPFNEEICKLLFMNTRPQSILMTAAAKGEVAGGFESDGGIFTFNFRETLVNIMNPLTKQGEVSWQKIISETEANTIKLSPATVCAGKTVADGECLQHPVNKVL
ncbi:MAG: caspase family protein [Ferruginibacter sp.]